MKKRRLPPGPAVADQIADAHLTEGLHAIFIEVLVGPVEDLNEIGCIVVVAVGVGTFFSVQVAAESWSMSQADFLVLGIGIVWRFRE